MSLYALIHPQQQVFDYNQNFIGQAVIQYSIINFSVSDPLFWVEVEIEIPNSYYDDQTSTIKPIPLPPEIPNNLLKEVML